MVGKYGSQLLQMKQGFETLEQQNASSKNLIESYKSKLQETYLAQKQFAELRQSLERDGLAKEQQITALKKLVGANWEDLTPRPLLSSLSKYLGLYFKQPLSTKEKI